MYQLSKYVGLKSSSTSFLDVYLKNRFPCGCVVCCGAKCSSLHLDLLFFFFSLVMRSTLFPLLMSSDTKDASTLTCQSQTYFILLRRSGMKRRRLQSGKTRSAAKPTTRVAVESRLVPIFRIVCVRAALRVRVFALVRARLCVLRFCHLFIKVLEFFSFFLCPRETSSRG